MVQYTHARCTIRCSFKGCFTSFLGQQERKLLIIRCVVLHAETLESFPAVKVCWKIDMGPQMKGRLIYRKHPFRIGYFGNFQKRVLWPKCISGAALGNWVFVQRFYQWKEICLRLLIFFSRVCSGVYVMKKCIELFQLPFLCFAYLSGKLSIFFLRLLMHNLYLLPNV